MKTLGTNLKEFREFNGLSQAELAKKLHTSQQRVSRWECDNVEPSLYDIVKILKLYNIQFEELIDEVIFDK